MKVSLRKANALQNAIQEHVKTIEVKTEVSLNEFQDAAVELTAKREAFAVNDQRRTVLTKALYSIRAKVGRANTESGVADLLSDAAYVDKRLAQLKGIIDSTASESLDVLTGKLKKLSEGDSTRRLYGYNDTISTGVLTHADIEAYKSQMRELKKLKQSINDKVLELNVRTEIELDESTVSLLQAEQLV